MSNEYMNYADIEVGDDIPSISRSIDTVQVLNFVNIWTGDTEHTRFNDPDTATKEGLAGPIVPGIMTMAFISRLLTEWARGADLKTLDVVFRGLVLHNVTHTLSGIVTDKEINDGAQQVQCDVFLENPESTRLIIGKAILEFPA